MIKHGCIINAQIKQGVARKWQFRIICGCDVCCRSVYSVPLSQQDCTYYPSIERSFSSQTDNLRCVYLTDVPLISLWSRIKLEFKRKTAVFILPFRFHEANGYQYNQVSKHPKQWQEVLTKTTFHETNPWSGIMMAGTQAATTSIMVIGKFNQSRDILCHVLHREPTMQRWSHIATGNGFFLEW